MEDIMRFLRYLMLLVFIFFLVLVSGQNHSQTKSSDEKTGQVNETKEHKSSSPVQIGTKECTTEASNKESKPKTDPNPWLTHGEWVMSGLTLVYVLLTAFYAYTSHKTLKALEQQGVDTKKEATTRDGQFSQQLTVSKDAAGAALLNATAVINSERPWIVVSLARHGDLTYSAGGQDHRLFGLRFTPVLTNYGRTLAKLESFRICPRVFNSIDDIPEVPEYVDGLPSVFQNALMIIPQDTRKEQYIDVSTLVSREEFENIRTGSKFFVCFGRVQYRDMLKPDVLHETRFSFAYRYRPDEFVIEGPSQYTTYT